MITLLAIFAALVLVVLYYKSILRMGLALLYCYLAKLACDYLKGFQFYEAFSTLFGISVLLAAGALANLFEDPPEEDKDPGAVVPLSVTNREIPDAECEKSKSLVRGNNFFV